MKSLFDIGKTQCPEFLIWLMNQIKREDSVLDVGCGNKWYHSFLNCKSIVGIDAWDKASPDFLIDLSKKNLFFPESSFDMALILDFIEHLEKERGKVILCQIQVIARRIILLTPLFWRDNLISDRTSWYYNNPYNLHLSCWREQDFSDWRRYFLPCFNKSGEEYFLGEWRKV